MLSQRRQWHATPVLLPGKSHGWRSLEGCSPWGRWGSGTTERLHFHFSLSCTREGNGNPLQCCCLENPRDGEAWWAAVYGVAQSRTWLKQLSSSSMLSRFRCIWLFMTPWTVFLQAPPGCSWASLGKNIRVGCHALLQGYSRSRDWTGISDVSCTGRRVLYH